jgi:acetyltransferase-like isoleucine patch superfamily enzyme
LLIIGAGGNAIDVISFLCYEEIYFIDDHKTGYFYGHKILGTTDDLCAGRVKLNEPVYNAVGSIGNNCARNKIYENLKKAGIKTRPLIMSSFISRNVEIGENVLAGIGSQIHHDCVIGESCAISPGVILCGNVKLGNNCFLGVGTNVIQGVTIGEGSIVGAGSLILRDVPPNSKVYGVWKG